VLSVRRRYLLRLAGGFDNFTDYQALIEQEDDVCESVIAAVFKHMVPGTRTGKIWGQVI
jgi:hypothetical protein